MSLIRVVSVLTRTVKRNTITPFILPLFTFIIYTFSAFDILPLTPPSPPQLADNASSNSLHVAQFIKIQPRFLQTFTLQDRGLPANLDIDRKDKSGRRCKLESVLGLGPTDEYRACSNLRKNVGLGSRLPQIPQITVNSNDTLEPIPPKIHFLHNHNYFTSPNYLCAYHSALIQNPTFSINVFASNKEDMEDRWGLAYHPRVAIRGINMDFLTKETPLEKWWRLYRVAAITTPKIFTTFAQKILILYKYGGAFMDNDMISLNGFYKNSTEWFWKPGGVMVQLHDQIQDGFMAFSPQHPFLQNVLEELVRVRELDNLDSDILGGIITKVLERNCKQEKKSYCSGLRFLPTNAIYPIYQESSESPTASTVLSGLLSSNCEVYQSVVESAYTLSWYKSEWSGGDKRDFEQGSLLDGFMKVYCRNHRNIVLKPKGTADTFH